MKPPAIVACAQATATRPFASEDGKHGIAGNVNCSSRQAALSRSART
jgi:hypothetical protein